MSYDHDHVNRLSRKLIDGINKDLDYVVFNGDPDNTYPGEEMFLFPP